MWESRKTFHWRKDWVPNIWWDNGERKSANPTVNDSLDDTLTILLSIDNSLNYWMKSISHLETVYQKIIIRMNCISSDTSEWKCWCTTGKKWMPIFVSTQTDPGKISASFVPFHGACQEIQQYSREDEGVSLQRKYSLQAPYDASRPCSMVFIRQVWTTISLHIDQDLIQ